jgi:hypothetical protein
MWGLHYVTLYGKGDIFGNKLLSAYHTAQEVIENTRQSEMAKEYYFYSWLEFYLLHGHLCLYYYYVVSNIPCGSDSA